MGRATTRILLYSHDAQGLGHVRRNLAIAHHLVRHIPQLTGREISGLLVSGVSANLGLPLPTGFDWLTIPGIEKGKEGYQARNLAESTHDLIDLRSKLLESALLSFAPDLVIIDRHIYGVWKELREPLRQLHIRYPDSKVVLGLREVLDEPAVIAEEWQKLGDQHQLRMVVDEVWVYGDQRIHDPIASGEAPPPLSDRIRFTGYLAHGRRVADGPAELLPQPFILTTAGGGSDGYDLLKSAVRIDVPHGHQHIIVTGPQIDDASFTAIESVAGQQTKVYRSWPGLSSQIASAAAVISMGGYNSVCEILASDTPALIIPREKPRREQLIRACSLREVGAVDLMRMADLSHSMLNTWAAEAVMRRVDRSGIALDGLTTAAHYASELLEDRCIQHHLEKVES